MKPQKGVDYILVRRAGYFDGSRTLQQHGNLIVTRNRIILNVLQTIDALAKLEGGNSRPQSLNPFKELKDATKEMKQSFKDAKEEYSKMKDFGYGLNILEEIAADCENLEELESRAAGMGEDNPKSFNIALAEIQNIDFGWIGPVKILLNNGQLLRIFISHQKKEVKQFLARYQ